MIDTVLVIPCFDEAARLDVNAYRAFLADEKGVGLQLVDDGSRDGTGACLARIREGYEDRVEVLSLPDNVGKAEAVRAGILRALEREPGVVGFWDADLATPLSALEALGAVLRERPAAQMVFGSRVKLMGREIHRNPWRHYLGRIFATVVSLLLRLPIYDTQCGAKLFRVTAELRDLFAEPFETRWLFDVEILARFLQARRASGAPGVEAAIVEYPLERWVDVEGSKVRPGDFLGALRGLFHIWRRYA